MSASLDPEDDGPGDNRPHSDLELHANSANSSLIPMPSTTEPLEPLEPYATPEISSKLNDDHHVLTAADIDAATAGLVPPQPDLEPPEYDDNDSAYDDDVMSSYLSLNTEANGYVFENGRRYHGYKPGRYMLPNDESEMDREDMKHHISMLITEGQLHLAPIGPNPQSILDIGTGTGIWAIDMADQYPSAKVVATDLSPIQPQWVPPNLVFEIDDAEADWLYKPHSIDFVHVRYLFHGIRNWPRLLQQAKRALRPGGWIELVEFHVIPDSHDGSLPADSHIMALYTVLAEIGSKIGIDLAVAQKFKGMMIDAGYEEVTEKVYDLPLGDYHPDRRMKEIGLFQRYQMTEGLHGIAFGILTRVAGWSPERVEVFLAGVRKEMKDRSVHSFYNIHFVYGRTPMND